MLLFYFPANIQCMCCKYNLTLSSQVQNNIFGLRIQGFKFKLGDCHFCLTVSWGHALSHAPGTMYKYTIARGRGNLLKSPPPPAPTPDPATTVDTVSVLIWWNHLYSSSALKLVNNKLIHCLGYKVRRVITKNDCYCQVISVELGRQTN